MKPALLAVVFLSVFLVCLESHRIHSLETNTSSENTESDAVVTDLETKNVTDTSDETNTTNVTDTSDETNTTNVKDTSDETNTTNVTDTSDETDTTNVTDTTDNTETSEPV
ncbi:dentin sialophosphoprotein-like [Gigantopelta aegis]|uniref:dentin sialophosphoprotein-like n=1 Tax=Gigantopelta aegis TaxID=1735272 RepID=UPI001B88748A|nr:dentin sialophosphoprotein-like [Gigantopelta aegis]